jgi:acetyl-CoA carboxylase biotin carboxylase subunit
MNTRVQVEHPTTEMVTGIDIVKEQIRIASGKKLQFSQQDVVLRGAAIECRIYAEDPEHNFLPSPGLITTLRVPGGPGIRDDSGIYRGFEVPVFYDPLLSKLVAWGRNREEAIERMKRALEEYLVVGIKTTIPFYQRVLRTPSFEKGNVTTSFIDDFFKEEKISEQNPYEDIALAAAVISEYERLTSGFSQTQDPSAKRVNAWKILGRKEGLRE